MSKLDEAKQILTQLGVPQQQQSKICCLTLLALAGIAEDSSWSDASQSWLRTHEIIEFIFQEYSISYAENTREVIRKQALRHFKEAAFIESNNKPTNSPHYRYHLTSEFLELVKWFNTEEWDGKLDKFRSKHQSLQQRYLLQERSHNVSVQVNNMTYNLSLGAHNVLQRDILETFVGLFVPSPEYLYFGDTTYKGLFINHKKLIELGIPFSVNDKLPDIVVYSKTLNSVFFIEAVVSSGPMDPKRVIDLTNMTAAVTANKVFVTAFPDFQVFSRFYSSIALGTYIWLSSRPNEILLKTDEICNITMPNQY